MDVTLLGSGDALGLPVPLCDCQYCAKSERRRRPSLLVETADTTVLFDAGPDLPEQLRQVGVTDLDAVFLTHHHYDHVSGLQELNHVAMPFDAHVLNPESVEPAKRPEAVNPAVYLTPTARTHLQYRNGGVRRRLDPETVAYDEPVSVGELTVVPFPVEHGWPDFDTVGFAVQSDGVTVAYAPDMWSFAPDRAVGRPYEEADLLVAEGAALFGAESHGTREDLEAALSSASAERTVLVNLNEHLQCKHTEELADEAANLGYELGADFQSYRL